MQCDAQRVWCYRGRRLRQVEWGLWRDLGRPGWFFLCYRPVGREGPVVRRWVYADGVHLRLEEIQNHVRAVRAQINARKVGIPLGVNFDGACAEYLLELQRRNRTAHHVAQTRLSLQRLRDTLPMRHVGDLRTAAVEKFLATLQRRGLGPRSLNKARGHLSGFCTWAIRRGYLTVNPALQTPRTQETIRLPSFPSPEDMCALVRRSDLAQARLWCLLAFTGLRLGSFLALELEDFRPDGILVRHTKRGCEWWLDYDDGCPLWGRDLSDLGQVAWMGGPPNELRLRKALRRASRDLGAQLTPHGFRHAFCSWLTMAGESLQDVAAWAHHSSAGTTERWYAHLRPRGQERAMANRTAVLTMRSQCMKLALGREVASDATSLDSRS